MAIKRWKETKINVLFTLKNGKRPSFSYKGKFPVYGANGIMGQTEKFLVNNDFILIFGRVGASGEIHLAKGKIWVSDNAIYTEKYDAIKIYPPFAFYFLKWKNLKQYATKTTHPIITQSFINSLKIPLPPLPIQKKIAEILSTVDEGIEKTDKATLKAERIKKGLMERLFREGAYKGKRKLKKTEIGGIPEEWEVVRLGEVGEFKNGINFGKNKKGDKGILTIDVLNMYGDNISISTESLYRVNIDLGNKKEYLLKKGDILFVRSSLKREGTGWASLFKGHNEPVTFCGFIIRFRLRKSYILPEFLTYFLRTNRLRKMLMSGSGQVAITNITQETLKSIKIPVPSISEQKEIIKILENIDKTIGLLKKRKKQLQSIKKALMEDLLTGKKEVKV
jgi:type I restriction enzyme S subunit